MTRSELEMMSRATRPIRRTVVVLAGLTLLGACANDEPTRPATPERSLARADALGAMAHAGDRVGDEMSLEEGALYVAELHPLNPRVQQTMDPDPRSPHGVAEGKAYFRVVNGMLHAVVDVNGAEPAEGPAPDGLHPQHIHAADRCPTQDADANGDGIVDVIEGLPYYGPILVSLDQELANLSFQLSFPVAQGPRGAYHYEASAPVSAIDQALKVAFPADPTNQLLDLRTRHVVVHGVDLATPLPSTVQTLNAPDGSPIPPQLTLPVACGEIHEVR